MSEGKSTSPVFCFMDESGAIGHPDARYFALGAIVHPSPDLLIERLHCVFEALIDSCSKEKTAQEFHWSTLTGGTLRHYEKCLDILRADLEWRFFSVVIDLRDPLFRQPADPLGAWKTYFRCARLMLSRNLHAHEKTTLLADFLRKPKGIALRLSDLPALVPQLWNVLQVGSQGVILIQMADVLLGGTLFEGRDKFKIVLSKRIRELREALGNDRFNEWRLRWDK